ncbi:hypothetical protein MC149_001840 [Salmonella enterica]|nr:hypothetical protein [Salmonella enterica]EIV7025267.1 hypothetical protein [Salmonella enterica]EIW3702026.1 hypothetical protein [Salmonella enterica]ELX2875605.1 hypothetical protein [Salmonella enterica]
MRKIINLFLFFFTLSISQSYAADNEYISVNNSKAFSFFLPTGEFLAAQYLDGVKRYSANEIINDFNDNELRAKKKYIGKFILNSTVRAIKQDLSDRTFVILNDDDGFDSFYAYYDKKAEDDLSVLNKGDNVEFICDGVKNIIMPSAECYSIALTMEANNLTNDYETVFHNIYEKQNNSKSLKITFILYSLLEKKIEKDCEESIEACNIAARKFTDNGALLGSMLEPYADMLNKISKNR